MSHSSATCTSLFLSAVLVVGGLPPVRAAQTQTPGRPKYLSSEAAFDPATKAFKKCPATPPPALATTAATLKKRPVNSANRLGFCNYRLVPERRAAAQPGFQFMNASFTHAQAAQVYEPAAREPVQFSLSNPDMGRLSFPSNTTDADGFAEVTFTAGPKRVRGALIVEVGGFPTPFPLEVTRPFPIKMLLLVGLAAAAAIGTVVVIKGREPIKPLPPPTIP